ncbi:type II toxin-antitoxin system HipA family toxin [Desulfobacterota bacterium M19]
MKSTVNLYVSAVFPDGQIVRVGRILSRNLDSYGRYEGFFRYAPAYLKNPRAYAVDPVHLPLRDETFAAKNHDTGIHMVFDDSLPDAWGRHILARKGGLDKSRFAPAHLLCVLRNRGLGRFLFSEQEGKCCCDDGSIPFQNIAKAIDEAGKLEDSVDTATAELRHLLACGSSAGGARPKVLTRKDNKSWLAKFASRKDIHPELFVSLEEAGMRLAGMAGLNIPELQRIKVGGRDVLLIKRFDVAHETGRNAIISFQTLLNIEDHYSAHYSDMAAIIRLHSNNPQQDLHLLFRQMVVNILLRNCDDHLQNFAMIHTEEGWRLSPSYDIVPNIYQTEQIIQVNGRHSRISADDIIREGSAFGLSCQKSRQLLRDVLQKISVWQDVFDNCGVPVSHTGKLRSDIARRFSDIGGW